jgi:hypothetical protein
LISVLGFPSVNAFQADHLRGLGLRRGRARGSHGAQAEGLIVV